MSLFSKKRIVYCVYRTKKVTSIFQFLNSSNRRKLPSPPSSPSPSLSRPIRYTIITLISHISIMKNYKKIYRSISKLLTYNIINIIRSNLKFAYNYSSIIIIDNLHNLLNLYLLPLFITNK